MTQKIDNQIAALEEALALGELSVLIDGKKIEYRSTSEIIAALRYFKAKKLQENGGGRSVRAVIGSYGS